MKADAKNEIPWGAVKIIAGRHKGKIMYYDDEDSDNRNKPVAICYLGDMFVANKLYMIPESKIKEVNTNDLMTRRTFIIDRVSWLSKYRISDSKRSDLMSELHYIDLLLAERMILARTELNIMKKKVFISHSSKDKQFAKWIAVDLANKGHLPWLDEWKIKAGESIPKKISEGLNDCDFILVVLSEHSVKSHWVENEWHAKYWHEVETGRVSVIPVLLQQCEIPILLKAKKYANFVDDYSYGFEEVIEAINI